MGFKAVGFRVWAQGSYAVCWHFDGNLGFGCFCALPDYFWQNDFWHLRGIMVE